MRQRQGRDALLRRWQHAAGVLVGAALLGLAVVCAQASAAAQADDGEGLDRSNAALGMPRFKGDAQPVPATGVAFAPGTGYLPRVFAADRAAGAGSAPGKDFWIDRMLARRGRGGGQR